MSVNVEEKIFDKGLANTIAAESRMSYIDGANGILEYVGIDIDSLARNSTFEETTYLLWNGRLPTSPNSTSSSPPFVPNTSSRPESST